MFAIKIKQKPHNCIIKLLFTLTKAGQSSSNSAKSFQVLMHLFIQKSPSQYQPDWHQQHSRVKICLPGAQRRRPRTSWRTWRRGGTRTGWRGPATLRGELQTRTRCNCLNICLIFASIFDDLLLEDPANTVLCLGSLLISTLKDKVLWFSFKYENFPSSFMCRES